MMAPTFHALVCKNVKQQYVHNHLAVFWQVIGAKRIMCMLVDPDGVFYITSLSAEGVP